MYIRPPRKRGISPLLVILILAVLGAVAYGVIRRDAVVEWVRERVLVVQAKIPFINTGPTPTVTPAAADLMASAEDLYRQGLLDEAIEKYEQAATLDPDNPTPNIRLALLLTLRQRTGEAVEKARQAIGIAPDSAAALAALCMALDWDAEGDQFRLQEALSSCLSATDQDPGYAEGHAYLAEVYADLGQTSSAVEAARLAVTLDDSSVFAHRDLGYALEKQRNYQQSVAEYQRANQLHPRLAQPYIDLGRIHMSNSRYKQALEAYERATVVDPGSAFAFDSLGWAYFQTGDHQRAVVVLEKATEVDPAFGQAYGHLGLTYYVLRNYEDAIPAYKKALELGEEKLEYYYELGLAYAYMGRCEEARPWLLKAIEIDNTADPAWDGLDLCPEE